MRIAWQCIILAAWVCLAASSAQALIYQHDDGTSEDGAGYGDTPNVPWWANHFTASPGGEVITNIQISFGCGGYDNGLVNGDPFVVALYEDTDDDGDPNTGLVLLASADATIQFNGTDTFQVVDITNHVVTGGFFVAAATDRVGNQVFPMSLDRSSWAGQSWATTLTDLTAETLADPAGHLASMLSTIDYWHLDGNWMLRAEAQPLDYVIPEPLTMLGVAAGVMAVGVRLRRRLRAA